MSSERFSESEAPGTPRMTGVPPTSTYGANPLKTERGFFLAVAIAAIVFLGCAAWWAGGMFFGRSSHLRSASLRELDYEYRRVSQEADAASKEGDWTRYSELSKHKDEIDAELKARGLQGR
jgi:hypothetical protein